MSHRVPSTLVPLYREEIYTQYLVLRCLATKKVCGLATTSPSLELFEEKKKVKTSGPPKLPCKLQTDKKCQYTSELCSCRPGYPFAFDHAVRSTLA